MKILYLLFWFCFVLGRAQSSSLQKSILHLGICLHIVTELTCCDKGCTHIDTMYTYTYWLSHNLVMFNTENVQFHWATLKSFEDNCFKIRTPNMSLVISFRQQSCHFKNSKSHVCYFYFVLNKVIACSEGSWLRPGRLFNTSKPGSRCLWLKQKYFYCAICVTLVIFWFVTEILWVFVDCRVFGVIVII